MTLRTLKRMGMMLLPEFIIDQGCDGMLFLRYEVDSYHYAPSLVIVLLLFYDY